MSRHTEELSVIADYSFDEKTINIHPNDGYDLGLMMTDAVVRIFADCTMEEFESGRVTHIYGTLHLKNETKGGTVEMSLRTAQRIGRPKKVRLHFDDTDGEKYGKVYIQPV
ncbi:MAG: hypothetical protein ACLFPO_04965 [Spirochaetaceae bacterium]